MTDLRDGLVLAAGLGSRLSAGEEGLKPLTLVAGVPLLERAVRSLAVAGCRRVVVVLGHGADQVQRALPSLHGVTVEPVVNPDFQRSNGLSVLAGAARIEGDFIMTMADHLLGDETMRLAGAHRPPAGGATLLVDRRIDQVFDLDDATKVGLDGDRIVRIGKQLERYDAIDVGVFVCTPGLVDALAAVRDRTGDASVSSGVQALADAGKMTALDVGDGFWQDIDTPAMLAHGERMLAARGG